MQFYFESIALVVVTETIAEGRKRLKGEWKGSVLCSS